MELKVLTIGLLASMFLVGCGVDCENTYDYDEMKACVERYESKMSPEEKKEYEAQIKEDEQRRAEDEKKQTELNEQREQARKAQEELEANSDIIYYEVFRQSDASNKFIVEGKYYLLPAHTSDMEVLSFEHKGFHPELDGKPLYVDRSFLDSTPERHMIYKVVFPKGKRDTALSVTLVYDSIENGW